MTSSNRDRFWGWRFHFAVRSLIGAYESACSSAKSAQKQLQTEFVEYRKIQAEALPEEEARDEWEQLVAYETHLTDRWEIEETTLRLVVEAFTIALFHLWEKQIRDKMRIQEYQHDRVIGWLKTQGFSPDARTLAELKLVAETLKHSNGRSARDLFDLKPTLFDPRLVESREDADYDGIVMTDHQFQLYVAAVETSGPPDGRIRL